jgi:hypothetical protein
MIARRARPGCMPNHAHASSEGDAADVARDDPVSRRFHLRDRHLHPTGDDVERVGHDGCHEVQFARARRGRSATHWALRTIAARRKVAFVAPSTSRADNNRSRGSSEP